MIFTPGKLYRINTDYLGFDVVNGPNAFYVKKDDLLLFLDYINEPGCSKPNRKVLCFLYDNKKIWRDDNRYRNHVNYIEEEC